MSYLSDLIKKVRAASGSLEQLKEAVISFKKEITKTVTALNNADNLRIFDDKAGGVLRGPKRSRAKRENKNTGNLLCQKRYLTANKMEVPYFKAVFNLPNHSFKASDVTVQMIGYESPLMRQKRRKTDNVTNSVRAISCDLVGLTTNHQILCIEGKVKPHNDATDIVYGILESFAYGVCVDYFLSAPHHEEMFVEEVLACVAEFHPIRERIRLENCTAAYSLAAPIEYFSEYFDPQNLTKEKADKRLAEAKRLMEVLKGIDGPKWAGFLMLKPTCNDASFEQVDSQDVNGKKAIEPRFKTGTFECLVANDIDDLKEKLSCSGATK
jgi:hypothetical protein